MYAMLLEVMRLTSYPSLQMRGQMAQLLAQDSADLDLSSELSKMVVAYNISLKDKAR